jgi:hypothetical protein
MHFMRSVVALRIIQHLARCYARVALMQAGGWGAGKSRPKVQPGQLLRIGSAGYIAHGMAKITITDFRDPFAFEVTKGPFHRRIIQAIPSATQTCITLCPYSNLL